MPLTDTALRALKPRPTRYEVMDRDGLLLEVLPTGRMTWRYRYTLFGKREKVTFGRYPALSLAEARKRRMEAEELVARDQSPARIKRRHNTQATAATVEQLAERWIKEVLRLANKNARRDETYLTRDCLPKIGRLAPAEVTTADVRSCVDPVLARGHGQAARGVRSVLKRLFDFGQGCGVMVGNPALALRPVHIAPTRSRSRTLQGDEIKQFLEAVHGSRISVQNKLALHFLLLVPARKGELIRSRWENVDLVAGTWEITASISKTRVPIRHKLPRQAVEILSKLRALFPGPWVLASSRRSSRSHISLSQLNKAMECIDELPEDVVVHDLRRTIRTGLADLGGVPSEVAELCLNHRPKGVAGTYDRAERINERAAALQRWADHVDSLCAADKRLSP